VDPWLDAARAMRDPDASIAVPEVSSGMYLAAKEVLRDWIASEASHRAGDHAEAARIARDGLGRAEAIGHVWLQLGLLRQLWSIAGDPERRDQFEALRRRIADEFDTPEERERVLACWEA
jgi:hypothetical protein